MSCRLLCTSHQSQGRILNASQCILVSESPRRTNAVKLWMEQHLTYTEKRQSKIRFNNGCWSLKPSGSLLEASAGQFAYMYYPCAAVERPSPLSTEEQIYQWDWPGTTWYTDLSRNKRAFTEPEGKTDIPTQSDKPSTLSLGKGWALYLLARKGSKLNTHS